MDWNPVPEPFILGYRVLIKNTSINEVVVPWSKTYAQVVGLHSSTRYVISVLPLHGLTEIIYPAEDAESIIITTEPERGKQILKELKFSHLFKRVSIVTLGIARLFLVTVIHSSNYTVTTLVFTLHESCNLGE